MTPFRPSRRRARPQLLNQNGRDIAVLMFGLALLFLVVLLAKGRL